MSYKYSKIFHLGFVFFITLAVVGFFSLFQVDPHHDGIILKPAIDVANGQILFKDTFAQYGALTTLLQSFAISWFGEYLLIIRLLTVLFYGLIAILLWLIYSRIMPPWLCTFNGVICLMLGYFLYDHPAMYIFPWPTVFAVFAVLASLYTLILFLERKQNSLLLVFLCGIFSSLIFWFKINYGLISFTALSLLIFFFYLVSADKKIPFTSFLAFLFGNFVVHAGFSAWLIINGSLDDFFVQNVKFSYFFSNNNLFSAGNNDSFIVRVLEYLFQVGSHHGYISHIWTIIPLVASGIAIVSATKLMLKISVSASEKILFAISSVSAGLWLGYYPINALLHMYLSSLSSIGLFIFFVWKVVEKIPIRSPVSVGNSLVK